MIWVELLIRCDVSFSPSPMNVIQNGDVKGRG
jgi:hypothetical protein